MTLYHDYTYYAFLQDILRYGRKKADRTNTGTTSRFGYQMRFNIEEYIPMLTSKKMHQPSLVGELEWYVKGLSNIKFLQEKGIRIWNEWADENGDLGPVYGHQWRNWPKFVISQSEKEIYEDGTIHHYNASVTETKVDQVQILLDDLKNNPDSRRLIISAWNVADLPDMKLPPCHYVFQFYTEEMTTQERLDWYNRKQLTELNAPHTRSASMDSLLDMLGVPRRFLSCMLNQRSADAFLGVPFNIAQYSMLTHLFAKLVNMAPREFIWSGGDCHIYDDHHAQVQEQLSRVPFPSPKLIISDRVENINDLQYNDFEIVGYESHPAIKAKVAV